MALSGKTVKVRESETGSKNTKNENNAKQVNEGWRAPESAGDTYAKKMRERFAAAKEKKDQQNQETENKAAEEKQNETKNEDKIAELTKQLEEATKKIEEQKTLIDEFNKSFMKRNQELAAAERLNKQLQADNNISADNLRTVKKDNERLSKANQDVRTSEPKVDNSAKTEETATPESEAKTEQAQATQEPKKETTQTSTESSEITPEEVYNYLSDKNNFKDAEQYFASGKDAYVGINNERIPKSWFDAYKENKDKNHKKLIFNKNNKDVFTASLRDKGLLEDPNKAPDRAETERVKAETAAKEQFDKSIATMGNKLLGVMGRHPYITAALIGAVGAPKALQFINDFRESSRQQDIEDAKVSDSAFFGKSDDNEDYNGSDPNNVTDDLSSAAQETEQTNNNVEEQAAQALQDNLPQGVADLINQDEGKSRVADNAVGGGTLSNAKQTPKQSNTTVAKKAPIQDSPVNSGSSGMTTSQLVESMGQKPQTGSMTYDPNKPDMVTSRLIDAMGQVPQAGSDAYGDLYDQGFIDFWAKRNPNLVYGVSQGRKA